MTASPATSIFASSGTGSCRPSSTRCRRTCWASTRRSAGGTWPGPMPDPETPSPSAAISVRAIASTWRWASSPPPTPTRTSGTSPPSPRPLPPAASPRSAACEPLPTPPDPRGPDPWAAGPTLHAHPDRPGSRNVTLHKRETIRDEMLESIYAGHGWTTLPTDRFPTRLMRPVDAYQAVADELMLDGNARQNLATFCQTWEEPEIHKLMDLSIDKNMVDKDEYPLTAEIESRCVHMLADLWNSPDAANTLGTSAVGSSEACMLGGMAMKWRWRARMSRQGKPTDRPNLVCGPVQICWHKFCRYWDVEMREIPMERGRFQMNAEGGIKRV